MNIVIEAYLTFLETMLVVILPLFFVLTAFAWIFAYQAWREWRDRKTDDPAPTLAVVLALTMTVAGAAVTVLVWGILYRSRVGALPPETLPLQATAVVVLALVSAWPVAYLLFVSLFRR